MNRYRIKCLMFTKNNNIKKIHESDEKINIYSHCNDCSFKNFASNDKEELSDLLKN